MGIGNSGNQEFSVKAQEEAVSYLAGEAGSTPRSIAGEIFRNGGSLADFMKERVVMLGHSLNRKEQEQCLRDWNSGTNYGKK